VTTSLIVAAARNDVIGRDGALPWHLPEDLRRFRRLTAGHPVVAGRLTHESIVARLGRALPGRVTVALSSRAQAAAPGVSWASSVPGALAAAGRLAEGGDGAGGAGVGGAGVGGEIFVIGGASVYEQALPQVDRIYLTRVDGEVDGDTRMPAGWLDGFRLVQAEHHPAAAAGLAYSFEDYVRERA
jgi:dihydrofolate reductase